MIDITIDKSVRELWIGDAFLAVVHVSRLIANQGQEHKLETLIHSVLSELCTVGPDALADPMVQRMRSTFRAMPEMDPARYRPASESLIRRCLDKGLFRISPLVDTNNILSVQLRIPLGIYCLDENTMAKWVYRIGYSEETYITISGQVKSAEGKLVIADHEGVIGSPVADSGRAAIKESSDNVSVVAYLPLEMTLREADLIVQAIESAFISIFEPAKAQGKVLM